jgi:sugar phosphate isomerase/epimerase
LTGRPKIVCCNFIADAKHLREFALDHEFDGVDWTLRPEDLPMNGTESLSLTRRISILRPLEIRYHLSFKLSDLGHRDKGEAERAVKYFNQACHLVSRLGGRFMTVHVGLGRDSMEEISWEKTLTNLANLAALGRILGIRVCLENLARGWTSRPDLYEKLIRKTDCWSTLDIGHAQVCASVRSQTYDVEDFAVPHPERILNAHVYHKETVEGHAPPAKIADLYQRLLLLRRLPLCDWWVLELRDEKSLLQTLDCVKGFLEAGSARAAM